MKLQVSSSNRETRKYCKLHKGLAEPQTRISSVRNLQPLGHERGAAFIFNPNRLQTKEPIMKSSDELILGIAMLAASVEFTICLSSPKDIGLFGALILSTLLGTASYFFLTILRSIFKNLATSHHPTQPP